MIQLTALLWLDNVLAIIFGIVIFHTGYKLIRVSVTGLLDEADYEKLEKMIELLNQKRHPKWIDIHNLRAIKYGSQLHVDCHITLPWYDSLEDSHNEVHAVEDLLKSSMDDEIEVFIHSDPCLP